MNIVLIGIGGSGKSTIGKLLAERLTRRFIDMDTLIEVKMKMSITQIVKKLGWDKFRDFESQTIDDLGVLNNIVIASGGGIVIRNKNILKLRQNSLFIWLKAGIDTLVDRIGNGSGRPILKYSKNIKKDLELIYAGRRNLYQKAANYTINTDNRTPDEITEEIITHLKNKNL